MSLRLVVGTVEDVPCQQITLSTSTETLSLVWTVWRGTEVSWILTSGVNRGFCHVQ